MFDHISKHLEVRQNTSLSVVFSTLFSLFGHVVKHGLSCLICYVKDSEFDAYLTYRLFWIVLLCSMIFILKVINSADQSQEDSTVLAFSSTSLNGLLKDFSQISYLYVGIAYVLMVR